LLLARYGRIPLNFLELNGDRLVIDQLVDWDPHEQDVTMRHLVRPRAK